MAAGEVLAPPPLPPDAEDDEDADDDDNGDNPPVLERAPGFQVTTIDGESIALDMFVGKVVVLDKEDGAYDVPALSAALGAAVGARDSPHPASAINENNVNRTTVGLISETPLCNRW